MQFKENICEKSDIQMEDAVINMCKYINLLSFNFIFKSGSYQICL